MEDCTDNRDRYNINSIRQLFTSPWVAIVYLLDGDFLLYGKLMQSTTPTTKLTQQGLEAGGTLGEPLPGVTLGEEDAAGDAIGSRLESEADAHEQILPPTHGAHLVLNGPLSGVHGVAVASMDPLQRFLNLVQTNSNRFK